VQHRHRAFEGWLHLRLARAGKVDRAEIFPWIVRVPVVLVSHRRQGTDGKREKDVTASE